MKINLSILSFSLLFGMAFAQVGIGTATPEPSTMLDVATTDKGFIAPNIALENRTDNQTIENPADGLLVYNTTTLAGNDNTRLNPGYYYWLTDRWVPHRKGELIEVTTNGELRSYLGYEPNGTHNFTNFSNGGITFTGFGCKQWTVASGGNGHWYCAYRGNTGFNWQTAFNAARVRGGHLATLTSLAEWQWVKTNLVDNTTGYNLTNSIWIGYNKVNFSGNPTEFTWITGEKSKVNWSNTSVTQQAFGTGEPNNSGGNEGCVHIVSTGINTNRHWNDVVCTSASASDWGGPYSDLIIEFEQ